MYNNSRETFENKIWLHLIQCSGESKQVEDREREGEKEEGETNGFVQKAKSANPQSLHRSSAEIMFFDGKRLERVISFLCLRILPSA